MMAEVNFDRTPFGEAIQLIQQLTDANVIVNWASLQKVPVDKDTPVTLPNWDKQKRVQQNKQHETLLSVGFSTFFLNRTNRSGILNAGMIGGRAQTGAWQLDARFNKGELIERIQRIAQRKDQIELYNEDALARIIHES